MRKVPFGIAVDWVLIEKEITIAETLVKMEWEGFHGHYRWRGREKTLGFGINRSFCYHSSMNRLGEDGRIQKWRVKSLP